MTDEEIKELAERTRKQKYCDKYNGGNTGCDIECEDNKCPLFNGIDGYYDHCINETVNQCYDLAFIDGYNAAFDVLIGKIKPSFCSDLSHQTAQTVGDSLTNQTAVKI